MIRAVVHLSPSGREVLEISKFRAVRGIFGIWSRFPPFAQTTTGYLLKDLIQGVQETTQVSYLQWITENLYPKYA